MTSRPRTAEEERLRAGRDGEESWRSWGPYVSDRQWGTVREDYSRDGDAWDFFPHDHARSRAYRWGEDAIAGWCDTNQRLVLGLALWNGRDPILKERFFGLTNAEGNHGEDVKELYWHLDALPSHAWQRMRYLYPQAAYPYAELVAVNRGRSRLEPEYELADTGIFEGGRYFDVLIDHAKPDPESVVLRVTVTNRGPEQATIDVLPQLWFRNDWSWRPGVPKPRLIRLPERRLDVVHRKLPGLTLTWFDDATLLLCENETNGARLFGLPEPDRPPKDALNDAILAGSTGPLAALPEGTKAGLLHRLVLAPGERRTVLAHLGPSAVRRDRANCEEVLALRERESEEFWAAHQAGIADPDARLVQRRALAGLLLSKQVYYLDMRRWLAGDALQPPPERDEDHARNRHWRHLGTRRVMAMPDRWEYPWFAAWDHAFHAVAFARLDAEFAKEQLASFLTDELVHPNGALPAYEWAFDDANPPLHAWASWRVYQIDRRDRGQGDLDFLVQVLNRLSMNFTWWVNRKDVDGRNVFEGGFLGLDNIGVFDRNQPFDGVGTLSQADGTAWMGMYALTLMRISIELSLHHPVYQDLAIKFFEHFLQIAQAMTDIGGCGGSLWNEEEGFYFDLLRMPDGGQVPLKLFSIVGLVPLFAVETLEPETLAKLPRFAKRLEWTLRERPELAALVSQWTAPGRGDRRLLSLLRGHRMKCLLRKALDPSHFLSDFGIRGVSRIHRERPYVLDLDGRRFEVRYEPGDGESAAFGGNSNWRGPIWFPINYLLIESLQKFHHYYGDDFLIECPVGSGKSTTLLGAADEVARRVERIFLRDRSGRRAVFGARGPIPPDAGDCIPFHEFFHGDTGEGLGARAQTGWTALVAKLLYPRRSELVPQAHQ